ncbi:MAG: hypothetical protein U5N85_08385 [Arcicella sp.]|nr:hypothetical protein [Arcicella sp.]
MDLEVHVYAYEARRKQDLENIGVICHDLPLSRKPFSWQNISAISELTDSFKEEKV